MQDRSEEQTVDRLLELENTDLADRRAKLTGDRYLSLVHDPESGKAYVFRHGLDETEGADTPPDTEFFEYPNLAEAERAYDAQLSEHRVAGELLDDESMEDAGDFESGGAELRDLDVDDASDGLVRDALVDDDVSEEEDEPEEGGPDELDTRGRLGPRGGVLPDTGPDAGTTR